jgi:putative nucleotidyltransferase with HDIG domain
MDTYTTIIEHIEDFPTLPTIYSSLLDLLSNPRTTVNDLADVILTDPASSAKILKTVNSSIYGLQVRVETISQAIFHVGFNEVKNLVMALSVIKIFSASKSFQQFNLIDLWKHSLAVGVITRLLGKNLNISNLENFYISGILHDIGKMFLLKSFNTEYSVVVNNVIEKKINLIEAEEQIFGINHCKIGQLIAEKWNLPESIINVINYHHKFDVNFDIQVVCVYLANLIAIMLELGFDGNFLIPQPDIRLWNYLNFNPDIFTELLPQIIRDYEQAVSILLISE